MIQTYLIGGALALVALVLGYFAWHHHVFQQGYDARVAEEVATYNKAKPLIEKEREEYEANVEAALSAPKTVCSNTVDPAISAVLDRVH